MREESGRSFHWAWIILLTCFFNFFINYSIRLGYGVILPEMIRTLGFSRTAGGSIYNAYFIVYIVLSPFTGHLTDRLGARRVITTCSLILGLGVLLMGTIKTLWMACLFYAIAGLGATGMWAPASTVVQRWFSPNRRGFALGILSAGPGLGFATLGVAFPWIVHHFNWRYAWYFLGTAALVMVLLNGLLLRSDPEESGCLPWGQKGEPSPILNTPVATHAEGGSLSDVFKNSRFWLIGVSCFLLAYCLYGIATFMVDYAKYQMGLSLEKAGLLASVHGLSQIVGVLTILPLSDVLGRKRAIILCNASITVCLIGILFFGTSWGILLVLMGIFGTFFGAAFPLYAALAGDYFRRDVMGAVIGAWTPFYGVGAILTHWVTGILRDTTGIYDYAFVIDTAMAAGALLFICLVKRNSNHKKKQP